MKRPYKLVFLALVLMALYLFWDLAPATVGYILNRRLVRVVAVGLVAYSLTSATVIFQGMTNNHILTPSLLGFDRMYLLIQMVLTRVISGLIPNGFGFVLSVVVMMLVAVVVYGPLLHRLKDDLFLLLLMGTVFGSLLGSITNGLQYLMDPNEFSLVQNQQFASLNAIQTSSLGIAVVLMFGAYGIKRRLNQYMDVVALGSDQAQALGVDMCRYRRGALLYVSLNTALVTSLVGPIAFLGLLTANFGRYLSKTYRAQSAIAYGTGVGVILLFGAQIILERIFHFHTSLTVLINLIGGVYFIYLLLKERFQ